MGDTDRIKWVSYNGPTIFGYKNIIEMLKLKLSNLMPT